MREFRSTSQILFGFLPNQTVDLKGRVWKVREWVRPKGELIDTTTLRREITKAIAPWTAAELDGRLAHDLSENCEVNILTLNVDAGVALELFPDLWICKRCKRVFSGTSKTCRCGSNHKGQLHFVGYHPACGALSAPRIPLCKKHGEVAIRFPHSASSDEIVFYCPECTCVIQKGFGYNACQCSRSGPIFYNVHRAASVFTPKTVVLVNPASPERVQKLSSTQGRRRALNWVLKGMKKKESSKTPTEAELLNQFLSQGIARHVAEEMVRIAVKHGQTSAETEEPVDEIPQYSEACSQAVDIALAVSDGRVTVENLISASSSHPENQRHYQEKYLHSLSQAGLHGVDLADRFPVLTGVFGYTRGDPTPGKSRLVAFRDKRRAYKVFADVTETEALLFRLNPGHVAFWLQRRGHNLQRWSSDSEARMAVLRSVNVPTLEGQGNAAGTDLLTLIHSMAHLLIRKISIFAGIDRNSLSEFLVPLHLGFFVYAASRGEFTLGGLQAVFETELNVVVDEAAQADPRCILDPGCGHAGGACMACLHIGEPSCRFFNRYLSRSVLWGARGYFVHARRGPS